MQDRGWVPAGELRPGDCVDSAAGECEPVQAIRLLDRPTLVYNFTVADAHSYFIGEGQWWVHNAPCGGKPPVKPFEVGLVDDLWERSVPGDGLQIHHVPQGQPAQYAVPKYKYLRAPGIALPDPIHAIVNRANLRGVYTGSARDLLARDLWNLRQAGVPTKAILELLDLVRKTYPGVF